MQTYFVSSPFACRGLRWWSGGQSQRWSIAKVVSCKGGQSQRWSAAKVVSRKGGQSQRWSVANRYQLLSQRFLGVKLILKEIFSIFLNDALVVRSRGCKRCVIFFGTMTATIFKSSVLSSLKKKFEL